MILRSVTTVAVVLIASNSMADERVSTMPAPVESENPLIETDPVESPRSVKLFDQKRAMQSLQISMGPLWYRGPSRAGFERGTGEILAGVAITNRWKPFYLSGMQETHLRVFDSKSFAWSLFTNQFAGGLFLGPIELEARIGVSLITADVFHGNYGLEFLSPRVGAGAGIHVGSFRVDIQVHSEYLWRWSGADYSIRGISLGLRVDTPRPKGPAFSAAP